MSFAINLKTLRMRKGESLQQLADAVGVSKPHIWQLERGESKNPSLELLKKLAQHFDTTIAALIEDEGQNMVFGREFKGDIDDDVKDMIVKMAEKLIDNHDK